MTNLKILNWYLRDNNERETDTRFEKINQTVKLKSYQQYIIVVVPRGFRSNVLFLQKVKQDSSGVIRQLDDCIIVDL